MILKYLVLEYALLASFMATFSTLIIKILGQMIKKHINQGSNLPIFTTILLLSILLAIVPIQLYWIIRALKYNEILVVVPLFHIFWSVLAIFTTRIYFQDFENFSKAQTRGFSFGLFMVFIGFISIILKIKNGKRIVSRKV